MEELRCCGDGDPKAPRKGLGQTNSLTVQLLPEVCPQVLHEGRAGHEALGAFGAFVGFLPSVDPLVDDEGGAGPKAFLTV